jgi:hypothetical protein
MPIPRLNTKAKYNNPVQKFKEKKKNDKFIPQKTGFEGIISQIAKPSVERRIP